MLLICSALNGTQFCAQLKLLWGSGGCTPQITLGASGRLVSTGYDLSVYPSCGRKMLEERERVRNGTSDQHGRADCELMAHVHSIDGQLCPVPPVHMVSYNASLAAAAAAFPEVSCSAGSALEVRYNISQYPLLLKNRLQRDGRRLLLDGQPTLLRAICYSPVPVGHDPGYAEPWGDYFTTQYEDIFTRDIELFVAMGANTIRLYTFKTSTRHFKFLDAADAANLIVLGAFEIGTAEHTPLATSDQRSKVKTKLRQQIRASKHSALVMWFVGNEINGAWQGFICDDHYAELHLSFTDHCQFADDAVALMRVVDSLCEVVHEEGLICSTPLAGVAMPGRYLCYPNYYDGCASFGPLGWVEKMDSQMQHLDVWSFNLYPGRDFVEFNFSRLEGMTDRPFFVSEYGIDAYNIDAPKCSVAEPGVPCNTNSDPRYIGLEDQEAQAEWVQSLIEGIEQNAVTCVAGCESNTVAGGSIMAWVDEWWKGRVIDAVDTDERNTMLGSLCSGGDKISDQQTPCGYPTIYGATQPDSFVNEEWFGLFRVKQPCDDNVDQIEPREAWYRIKWLWKQGGCLLHDQNFSQLHRPAYAASEYPQCGAAVSETRRSWNYSAVRLGTVPYPFSCHVMQLLHEENPALCPSVPAHMVDTNSTLWQQRANWTDTPAHCTVHADPLNIVLPLVLLIVVLTFYSKNKNKLLKFYHNNVRKPMFRLLRGGFCFRLVAFLLGAAMFAIMCSLVGLALGSVVGEVVRAIKQDAGDAVITVGSWVLGSGPYAEAGASLGACIGGIFGIILSLGYVCVRALARKKQPLVGEQRDPHTVPRGHARAQLHSTKQQGVLPDPFSGSLLLHPSVSLKDRPSQRLFVTAAGLQSHVMPVAAHLARIFGFQTAQLKERGKSLEEVSSNVACQVYHLCSLLAARMQHRRFSGLEVAFQSTLTELHMDVFANYRHWRHHLQISPEGSDKGRGAPCSTSTADASDHEASVRLHELLLFHLIHGEAANLRHTPEALCFIFYCARLRLRFPRGGGVLPTDAASRSSMRSAPLCEYETAPASSDEFLRTIVGPMYTILQLEIFGRRTEKISQRVMCARSTIDPPIH